MIAAKCIQKYRNNQGKIYGYRIIDGNMCPLDIETDKLKAAIRNKEIDVINLTLTSDNRLIDSSERKSTSISKSHNKKSTLDNSTQNVKSLNTFIENLMTKSKALGIQPHEILSRLKSKGFNIETIDVSDGHCFLYSHLENTDNGSGVCRNPKLSDKNIHIVYIPDDIQHLNLYWVDAPDDTTFSNKMRELHGKIIVIGGNGLDDTVEMFYKCPAKEIDLSYFNTANVRDMHAMFRECEATEINLKSLNTSNVKDMSFMFYNSGVKSLDLSSFNTENLDNICSMFAYCEALNYVNLSSFELAYHCYTDDMFYDCYTKIKATDEKIIREYKESQEDTEDYFW